MKIEVKQPTRAELESSGVLSWPIWTCDASTFDWSYSDQEVCYLLEGQVTVVAGDQTVRFGKGDMVTFPKGLECVWKVSEAVRKHYRFGD